MGEIKRRGAVMLLQAGDKQIVEALTDGIMAGRAARLEATQIENVEEEIDRQAIRRDMEGDAVQRALLRVAVNNTKTAEDYAAMTSRAEIEWGEPVDYPTPLERFADAVLALYAMVICGLSAAYHAQDKLLEGNRP